MCIIYRYQPKLSYSGGQPLEYIYLSGVTGDAQYSERVVKIRTVLKNVDKDSGLYRSKIDIDGKWLFQDSALPSLVYDSSAFYFGLLKSHLQSAGRDAESLHMYRDTIESMEKSGKVFRKSLKNRDLDYALEFETITMHQSACYLGAMLSLGAQAIATASTGDSAAAELAARHRQLAEGITETCHTAANRTKTGLMPGIIIINGGFAPDDTVYLLR